MSLLGKVSLIFVLNLVFFGFLQKFHWHFLLPYLIKVLHRTMILLRISRNNLKNQRLYFLMGYYSVRINIKERTRKIPLTMALGGILFIFTIVYFTINFHIGYIIYYVDSYYLTDRDIAPEILCIMRIIAYIAAIIISIFIMRIVLYKEVFPKYGSKTLFIYMYHTFIVLSLRSLIAKGYLPQNEIILLFYTIAILIGLILLSKISFFTFLMNPITYISKKHHE